MRRQDSRTAWSLFCVALAKSKCDTLRYEKPGLPEVTSNIYGRPWLTHGSFLTVLEIALRT